MAWRTIKRYSVVILLLIIPFLMGGAPSRTQTYTSGEVIDPADVTENEDNMFRYLQSGVDTYADSSIVNADISGNAAIGYSKLSLGSSILSSDIKDGEIVNADISASASISDSKLAQITTASKVSGAALTSFSSIPSGAGEIPIANIPAGTGANQVLKILSAGTLPDININAVNITSGTVPAARLGSGTPSSSNYLRGDNSWQPIITTSQVNDTDAGTTYSSSSVTTFLSVAKTITSGNTVLLIATGYLVDGNARNATITLKHGSTTVQTIVIETSADTSSGANWSASSIVTGLSGAVTFTVTATASTTDQGTIYGNLTVLEF